MRIISGEFRGRILLAPKDDQTTRPITDRAKQSIFDVLNPLIEDALIYDCFSGTGSMGLECLSRGAAFATFFDADRFALSGLRQNIDTLGLNQRSKIIAGDLFKWLKNNTATQRANLIFFDPPYRFLDEKPDILRETAHFIAMQHLAPGGTVVFRHDSKDQLTLSPFRQYDKREYGSMTIELLTMDEKEVEGS